jgi:hypothetical protein
VFVPYLDLLKARYRFHPAFSHAKSVWEEKLNVEALVRGPYMERSQAYAPGAPLTSLDLHKKTIQTVERRLSNRTLYKHQTEALEAVLSGGNVVVATGTSSGKTLCYQIPILDDLIRDCTPGLRAIIIYPLNALVNDQLGEWEEILREYPSIRFARFSGQTPGTQGDYQNRLEDALRRRLEVEMHGQQELQREVSRQLREQLRRDREEISNRLNHRDQIRLAPPHILITNFSMLEYLLERPVDAPIFENARLKFIVLDEVHAYRGVQATEIGFLLRRLRDRLNANKVCCIATSATLGKKDDPRSIQKVREFASALFGAGFDQRSPIYGTIATPVITNPVIRPSPDQYIRAATDVRAKKDPGQSLGLPPGTNLLDGLLRDENLHKLRKDILTVPKPLASVAAELWPKSPKAEEALNALLEVVASAKELGATEDLLPTRLHYFVKAEDGLHICLSPRCPARREGKPSLFVTRNHLPDAPIGYCPDCHAVGMRSQLVELVSCRKCGYLYGALQDLGPRRARNQEAGVDEPKPCFDAFSTELGWAADSFWTYFSIQDELPFPSQAATDEEEDADLIDRPERVPWCTICGKRKYNDAGDDCQCAPPLIRELLVFHRQCPHSKRSKDQTKLYGGDKELLPCCPNCGGRNASGLEPVRRFQESDDEVGLAMAIPLAHFNISSSSAERRARKLLCFTDNRQRAAAFPSLLEEETFGYDLGRKIVSLIKDGEHIDFISLGERLAESTDPASSTFDPNLFLPASRKPEEQLDKKRERDLWVAEVFAYFGVPDSARESAEDFGLLTVEYETTAAERDKFHALLQPSHLTHEDSAAALQSLLAYVRQRKIFTLPRGRVLPDAPAFGRITADIALLHERQGRRNAVGWTPQKNVDGSYRDNYFTDYIRRLTGKSPTDILAIAEAIWQFLITQVLLIPSRGEWKLDHERIFVRKATARFVCDRCGIVTTFSARGCCPKKGCLGRLGAATFNPDDANLIARWVAGDRSVTFSTLRSEEHTAQINKDLAKTIEDDFRAQGLNLLSSTTTFEMGINIGDLQKVLLRNAPPSSASYIQRVGRAGRGKDKNAVCVTMCRRTKYDSDAWSKPQLLMSGEVRTPSVFVDNRIIAQRHFNAVAFADFLRIKIRDERVLGDTIKQKIRLEVFLPIDSRRNIPTGWIQARPTDTFLDFIAWLAAQNEVQIFHTEVGKAVATSAGGFVEAREGAISSYRDVINRLGEELAALVAERGRLVALGEHLADIERSIKELLGSNVIDIMAREGFLPRYAFPLDVVSLETGKTRWSRDSDVELSRERGLAIAEFAPGAQVIAHKKVFTSAGLYIMGNSDVPVRRWFSRCRSCEQIRTAPTQDALKVSCSVCGRAITIQDIKPYIQPAAFSVRLDSKGGGAERFRRGTLLRQRQTVTQFIDAVEDPEFKDNGLFRLAMKEEGSLFRYNLGPQARGFSLCPTCGSSEPEISSRTERKHKRLRVFSGTASCGHPLWRQISYGHVFQSYCLIARPIAPPPSVESLAYALQRGICRVLDVESQDIGVSWRWLGQKISRPRPELIFFDLTPGGAGFVKQAMDAWASVVTQSAEICSQCTCEMACYDCLKTYSNQAYHEKLVRNTTADFLARS